jgi:ergothioneine biosynthesis protein EgtB
VDQIYRYRQAVDEGMYELLETELSEDIERLVTLGLHHEQQHQELMLTDIKHVFACSPLHPVYQPSPAMKTDTPPALHYIPYESGLYTIGHSGEGFGYDNEFPRHQHFLQPFGLASRLITTAEYIHFIHDGGYKRPELWLSDGWSAVEREQWQAPYYWELVDRQWHHFTLNGFVPVDPHAPVCHVSFYEADAYARWAGQRLPTEQEWEIAAHSQDVEGNFLEHQHFTPIPLPSHNDGLQQMYGDVWEWTSSPYMAYPGYRAAEGAIGEYNGKFMCNQMVLRGGSCLTSRSHIRPTYRNFFYPNQRWQFMGFRLAKDL